MVRIDPELKDRLIHTVTLTVTAKKVPAFVDPAELAVAFISLGPRAFVGMVAEMVEVHRQFSQGRVAEHEQALFENKAAKGKLDTIPRDS